MMQKRHNALGCEQNLPLEDNVPNCEFRELKEDELELLNGGLLKSISSPSGYSINASPSSSPIISLKEKFLDRYTLFNS